MVEEKKEEIEKVGKVEMANAIEQSEAAIAAAGEMLEGFESIVTDDKKRTKATTGSGVVIGTGINYLLDYAEEKDVKKRNEAWHKGSIVCMEVAAGAMKTLLAGGRRRVK